MSGVVSRVHDGVGHVVFDNQARRNALTSAMEEEALTICRNHEADPAVKVVVFSGAGDRAFVSGRDINEIRQNSPIGAAPKCGELEPRLFVAVRSISKPTVAVIRGYCIGGGVALACACDLRIASDDALFGIPAARLGMGYRAELTNWLIEAVGPATTREILLTARRFDAGEALRIGLVHRVVPAEELAGFVDDYVAGIASNAPLSMRAAKTIVNELSEATRPADLERCEAVVRACLDSDDLLEGRRAFLEKRRPNFTGK